MCSSVTLRVKLLTTTECEFSGPADRERLLRVGDLPRDPFDGERPLDNEREGDLEVGLQNICGYFCYITCLLMIYIFAYYIIFVPLCNIKKKKSRKKLKEKKKNALLLRLTDDAKKRVTG